MTIEYIIELIRNLDPTIDQKTLKYFSNYFFVLVNNKNIFRNLNLEKMIKNALLYASKIEFYTKDSEKYKELGPDCKGLRDPESKTIFIRGDLEDPLKEITVYHELHHAVQTNPQNDMVGINQETNFGRMIMEAQTQYFAEEIYQQIHQVKFNDSEKSSSDLRMLDGGTIVSSLHNYEMYDSLLSRLSILLQVPKDFFVYINFLYDDNQGMSLLKERYEEYSSKYKFPYNFEEFMFRIDYIYCVDLLAYKDNPDKEIIKSGNETKNIYDIYDNKSGRLSLKKEFDVLDDIDRNYFLCLLDNNGDYTMFANYICKNETRNLANQIINAPVELETEDIPPKL